MTQSNTSHLAIDVTADRCPMTYVRTRLALDKLISGQILAVTMRGDEPATNVPRTAVEQGHEVLGTQIEPNGDTVVFIRKG
jgi:TusA-related sulfurtransferase